MKLLKKRIAIVLSISLIIGSVMPAMGAEETAVPVLEETAETVFEETAELVHAETSESALQETSGDVLSGIPDTLPGETSAEASLEEDAELLGFVPDYSVPMYFEGNDSPHYIKLKAWTTDFGSAPAINIQCSTDNKTWKNYLVSGKYTEEFPNGDIPIAVHGKLYFKAIGENRSIANGMLGGWNFSSDSLFKVAGNAMSLLYEDFEDRTEFAEGSSYNFYQLFYDGKEGTGILTDASELLLPATTVNEYGYYSMFNGCKYLTRPPKLPATELNLSCYLYMFRDCTSLREAPELPATELAVKCYYGMFMYCASLVAAPELPATELTKGCYEMMFYDCSNLTMASELPAKTLAPACYESMFQHCDRLETPPVMLAETLAEQCCYSMFEDCSKLQKTPLLLATELVKNCYTRMFGGCVLLQQISVGFSHWDDACLKEWVIRAGWQNPGVFYCPGELPEEYGASRIPNSWNVKKNPVTICFHANDGTENHYYDADSAGAEYTLPNCKFHEGDAMYDFKGWAEDPSAESGNPAGTIITLPQEVSSEINLYAVWSKNIHTVTFDANGGGFSGASAATVSVADGRKVKPLKSYPTWTEEDSFTEKWYTEPLCQNEYDFDSAVNADITLYAGWIHTIKWYDGTELLNTSTIHQGATPSYTGSMAFIERRKTERFAGWSPELAPAIRSLSCHAVFEGTGRKYEVQFETNGGSYVLPQIVNENAKAIEPASPKKPGYDFTGWYADPAFTTPFNFDTLITGNTVIYAKWNKITVTKYTIRWEYKPDCGLATSCEVNAGEFPEFPGSDADLKETGYSFYGWMEAGTTVAGVKPAAKNTTYQAMYIPDEWMYYYVLFDGAGGTVKTEYVAIATPSAIAEPEQPEREGYTFAYWYETDTSERFDFEKTVINRDMVLHAKWLQNTYQIRWLNDDSEEIGTTIATHGQVPHFPEASESELEKDGYIFDGWRPAPDAATEDAEYIAQYLERPKGKVVVSFDVNGGSFVPAQIIDKNATASEPAAPSKAGFTFDGWCSDDAQQQPFNFSTPVATDTVVHAKWNKIPVKTYNITWNYGHDLASTSQCQVKEGELPVFIGSTKDAGYTFVGWYASGSDAIGVFPATEDMTYNAFYIADAWLYCYVLFDGAGGTVKTEYEAVPYDEENPRTIPEPEQPEREGYIFRYWYATDENTPFRFSTPITEDMILHARWEKKSYNIRWMSYDDKLLASASVNDGDLPCFNGMESELAREGFIFYGWSPEVTVAKADAKYKAKYIARPENKYVVSFFANGGSNVLPQTVSANGRATLPEAPSRKGYTFDKWYRDEALTQEYDFGQAVTADITLHARWIANRYTVTWIVDGRQTQETYSFNQKPSYKGTAEKSGYVFAGWNPMLEPVSENVTYTAQFVQTHYSGGGGGGGSVNTTQKTQGAVNGLWTYHPDTGKWTFAVSGVSYVNQWALVANPYAVGSQPAASWFYFDAQGNMLTGWQWIKGSDGITRCYYLNPFPDNTLGACFMGPGVTPDGFTVDANGAWTVNGIVQTR